MGRAKQRMELISSRKSRYATYRKREKGMKKKAHELQTLCDVEVCLIAYPPTMDERPFPSEAETWPENSDTIHRLIDFHKNQPTKEDRMKRSQTLSNFFIDRNQKVEGSLVKLRKKNDEATYSTWDDRYSSWSMEQLRGFEVILEGKLQDGKARIAFMKNKGSSPTQIFVESPNLRNMQWEEVHEQQPISILLDPEHEFDVPNLPYPFSTHQIQQGIQIDTRLMANRSMMMPNNNYGNHYGGSTQLGGASCSKFVCDYDPVLLETTPTYGYAPLMPGTLEDMMIYNNCPLPVGYFNPNMETMSPYLGCFNMGSD